jgi:hypothetical protein
VLTTVSGDGRRRPFGVRSNCRCGRDVFGGEWPYGTGPDVRRSRKGALRIAHPQFTGIRTPVTTAMEVTMRCQGDCASVVARG